MIRLPYPPSKEAALRVNDSRLIREKLLQNEIIVYPTDTLYGLGVDAGSETAIKKLNTLKGRQSTPMSVLLGSVDDLLNQLESPIALIQDLIYQFLPGPLTVVAQSAGSFPTQLIGPGGGVGFRIPAHGLATQLVQLLGRPLTTTSVNPVGASPARSYEQVSSYFPEGITLMLDTGVQSESRGSTVIDTTCQPFRILREGEISRQTLQKYVN